MIVDLEDERNFTGEIPRARLDEPQRRGVGVAARLHRQLEMVARIVAGRIDGEAAGRAVLEALVNREDDQAAGAAQFAVVQEPGQVGQGSGVVAAVPA